MKIVAFPKSQLEATDLESWANPPDPDTIRGDAFTCIDVGDAKETRALALKLCSQSSLFCQEFIASDDLPAAVIIERATVELDAVIELGEVFGQ